MMVISHKIYELDPHGNVKDNYNMVPKHRLDSYNVIWKSIVEANDILSQAPSTETCCLKCSNITSIKELLIHDNLLFCNNCFINANVPYSHFKNNLEGEIRLYRFHCWLFGEYTKFVINGCSTGYWCDSYYKQLLTNGECSICNGNTEYHFSCGHQVCGKCYQKHKQSKLEDELPVNCPECRNVSEVIHNTKLVDTIFNNMIRKGALEKKYLDTDQALYVESCDKCGKVIKNYWEFIKHNNNCKYAGCPNNNHIRQIESPVAESTEVPVAKLIEEQEFVMIPGAMESAVESIVEVPVVQLVEE